MLSLIKWHVEFPQHNRQCLHFISLEDEPKTNLIQTALKDCQIEIFKRIFEEKLNTHIDDFCEFYDSEDNVALFIDPRVPDQ
jgi:hypothetical protein